MSEFIKFISPVNKDSFIMMNADQLNSYLEKLHANDDDNNKANAESTEAKVEEPKAQEAQTADATQELPKAGSEEVEIKEPEAKPAEETEKKPAEDKKSGKKYSKQEQIDYSFQKLKTREEAKRRKLEARIKELETALSKKDKAPSYEESKEDYIRYEVDRYGKETEKQRLEQEILDSKRHEAEELNRKRIEACFTDETEREKYNNLVKTNGPEFVKLLDREDPESVILGYLDDSDISPILVRILMTNKEYRNEVLSKTSPYGKQRAMENLEAKVRWAQQQLENRKKKEQEKEPVQEKPKIPVVGTVTKSDSSEGNNIKDYNDVLHKLNQRKYN